MNKKFFLYIYCLTLIFAVFSMPAISNEERNQSDNYQKLKEAAASHPDYKKLLAEQGNVGFDPQEEVFFRIERIIKGYFYGSPSDKDLTDSILREINALFEASGKINPLAGKAFASPSEAFGAVLSLDSDVPRNLLKYACICGLLKGTGDPYSSFLTPSEYKSMMESLQSSDFGGIGIYLELDKFNDNILTIIEPIEGAPAWNQGLKAGDMIMEIDGTPTQGLDIDMCSSRLRGPKGSEVNLTIRRKDFEGVRKYTIVRDIISAKTISSHMEEGNTGYIRIRSFGRKTAADFKTAFNNLQSNGMKSLIIDLRNNGGGYVNAALDIAGIFIENGKVIASVKNASGKFSQKLSRSDYFSDLPLVILVNRYSASASELMAAAFQDHERAVLVGTNTFGKGSIQQLMPLRDGSAFKVTVAHYCTPSGKDIDKIGLKPNAEIQMEPELFGTPEDAQIKYAKEILKTKFQ